MNEQTQPTDAALQSIIDDADAGPPTDKAWLCLECGRWTPWRHEEAHDHADGCKAPAIYAAKRDWKTRLKDYMANRGTPAGAGEPVGYINRGMAPHTKGKVVFHEKPTENLEARWWSPDEVVYTAPTPQAVREPLTDEVRWCGNCGEGVTFFCRSKTVGECPMKLGRVVASGITKGGQHGS